MPEQRKLAAVMFTDISGYTSLMSEDEQKALAILEKNRTLQKNLAKKHNGEFLKEMGDGTLLCFQSALDAVRCAMEIQESVKDDSDLNLRIGIHLGDIVFKDGDMFGDGVNVALRIEHLAAGGEICVSEEIYRLVKNKPDIPLRFFREDRLKHIDHPVRLYKISGPDTEDSDSDAHASKYDQPEKSIIVLPFVNISPDPDQEYFSDGLTEEIITDLSRIKGLLVISRSSAMTLKGSKKSIPEIARSVKVTHVLEGSVRKAGNNLRITAQLIDAVHDTHLWADKYSGTLDDIFDIQEKVSRSIAEALKGRLSRKDKQQLVPRMSSSGVGIYDAYTRANYVLWTYESGSHQRALQLLEDAVRVFGEHPLLLAGIGAIHWQFYHQLGDVDERHVTVVRECVEKLFKDNPASAPGHRLQSYLLLHEGSTAKALTHLKKAMEGDPADTETLLWISYLLAIHAGRPELSYPLAEKWFAVDPLHPISRMCIYLSQWMTGDLELAVQGLEKWVEKDPDNPISLFYLGHVLAWCNRKKDALNIAEKMHQLDSNEVMGQAFRFMTLALNGHEEKARKALSEEMRECLWMDFHLPWVVAEGYALLGEKEEALRWLERAVDKGIFNYPMLNEMDPLLEGVRKEPRFKKLMQRVKRKWEMFEV